MNFFDFKQKVIQKTLDGHTFSDGGKWQIKVEDMNKLFATTSVQGVMNLLSGLTTKEKTAFLKEMFSDNAAVQRAESYSGCIKAVISATGQAPVPPVSNIGYSVTFSKLNTDYPLTLAFDPAGETTIDWGDGNEENIASGQSQASHTYAQGSLPTVKINKSGMVYMEYANPDDLTISDIAAYDCATGEQVTLNLAFCGYRGTYNDYQEGYTPIYIKNGVNNTQVQQNYARLFWGPYGTTNDFNVGTAGFNAVNSTELNIGFSDWDITSGKLTDFIDASKLTNLDKVILYATGMTIDVPEGTYFPNMQNKTIQFYAGSQNQYESFMEVLYHSAEHYGTTYSVQYMGGDTTEETVQQYLDSSGYYARISIGA